MEDATIPLLVRRLQLAKSNKIKIEKVAKLDTNNSTTRNILLFQLFILIHLTTQKEKYIGSQLNNMNFTPFPVNQTSCMRIVHVPLTAKTKWKFHEYYLSKHFYTIKKKKKSCYTMYAICGKCGGVQLPLLSNRQEPSYCES